MPGFHVLPDETLGLRFVTAGLEVEDFLQPSEAKVHLEPVPAEKALVPLDPCHEEASVKAAPEIG